MNAPMQNGLASRSSLASVIKTAAVRFSLFQFSSMTMVMKRGLVRLVEIIVRISNSSGL